MPKTGMLRGDKPATRDPAALLQLSAMIDVPSLS